MKESAYLLGRFLSLLDQLHLLYCQDVRNGDVPPKLLGNAFIPVICDNPSGGLGRLLSRLTVYKAWATKTMIKKEAGIVRWCNYEISKVADVLAKAELPEKRLDEKQRAWLLLGYLAPNEKKDKSKDPVNSADNGEKQAEP